MDHLWTGHVTQVNDPHYFWMQLGSAESLFMFEKLQLELQRFCSREWSNVLDTEELERGQVVVVDTADPSDRGRFRRGQIARITSENSVDIFYVDYGYTELTTVDRVCVKYPPPFNTCPPQAVRCSLAGVKPISKSWTNRGTKTFQTAVLGQTVYALVLYGTAGYCEVSLYSSPDENGRSITHLLLDEEVALPIGEVPERVSQISEFMARMTLQASANDSAVACNNNDVPKETKPQPSVPDITEPSINHAPQSSKPVERYAPPRRKHPWDTASSQDSNLSTSPSSSTGNMVNDVSPSQKSPNTGLALNTSLKVKEQPVVDFFPFETVSTYPPSPVSPIKSPNKSPISAPPGFNRAPSQVISGGSKHSYHETVGQEHRPQNHNAIVDDGYQSYSSRRGDYQSYSKTDQRGVDRNHMSGASNQHKGSGDSQIHRGGYTPPRVGSVGQGHRYDQNHYRVGGDTQGVHRGEHNHERSTGGDGHTHRAEHHERSRFAAKFNNFPAADKVSTAIISGKEASAALEPSFLQSTLEKTGGSSQSPGRFSGDHGSHVESTQRRTNDYAYSSPARQDFGARKTPFYAPHQNDTLDTQVLRSPEYFQQHHHYHPNTAPYSQTHRNHGDYGSSQSMHQQPYHDKYYQENGYHYDNSYSANSKKMGNTNSSNSQTTKSQPRLEITKTPGKLGASGHEEALKSSPLSPESPIAAFDMNDLDHTQHLSTDDFHKQFHQEKLQKLQLEQADIEKEAREQVELTRMARYCGIGEDGETMMPPTVPTDMDQITEESRLAKFSYDVSDYEQFSRSQRRTRGVDSYPTTRELELTPKLAGIPSNYLEDIDFCEAVRDALDFGKSDGIENAKPLLDGIVEPLRSCPPGEKQLYSVVSLLVSRAVEDYNILHPLILDIIDALSTDLDIKEYLSKALKRQQEICVRFPATGSQHLNLASVMALIYNMAASWTESNSGIQDCILVTLEKWIVFNNKGSQIGQSEKENVFLDCFGAFWEISGKLLLKSNVNFTSRIQADIRRKVLNEQVARSIRERLLDVLQELSSPSLETQDAGTQTVRRTMIPSSCQVKPTTVDKSCQTRLASNEMSSMYDEEFSLDDPWVSATEKLSIDISLRPQGHPIGIHQSTPLDADRVTARTGSLPQTPTGGAAVLADVSYINSMTDSVYGTPNESRQSEVDLSNSLAAKTINYSNVSDSNTRSGDDPVISWTNNPSQVHKHNLTTNRENKHGADSVKPFTDTSNEKLSEAKKRVVDWFEYVSEADGESNKTDKLQEKRLEARKQVEKIVDINGPDSKENKTKHKKNKKAKKLNATDEVKSEEPSQSAKSKPEPKIDSTAVSTAPVISEDEQDKPVDWWGVGGDLDLRPPPHTVVSSCDIYTDPGPDVIIEEEEVEQLRDNTSANSEDFDDEKPGEKKPEEENQGSQKGVGVRDNNPALDDHNVSAGDINEFASDLDDDFDDWESNESDDLDMEAWGRTEENSVDVVASDEQQGEATPTSPARSAGGSKSSGSTKFTTVPLAEFLKSEDNVEPTPPQPRWVPGRRVCLSCQDPSHFTDSCPKGVTLFN